MRKSLVKTLAVTMAAVMCAGLVSGCGAGSDSKKADTQAREQVTAKQRTRAMSLRCLALEAALIIFLST